ncbi:MAG: head GIN domain-containing protein, partial [Flavobacteriaceae bacterium]|nr:head GIN domain-containing protein [Flavobacteriaceae bacterium]
MNSIKKLGVLIVLVVAFSCDTDNAIDCLKTSGSTVVESFEVDPFDKITVFDGVKLIVQQGAITQVSVETGSNLLSDIAVSVEQGRLSLRNKNTCNLFRSFENTIVRVTTPTLTELRNASGFTVESDGVLAFPQLLLLSEDFNFEEEISTTGNFDLALQVDNLRIVSNNLSTFFLQGSATQAEFSSFSGDGRIFAEQLLIDELKVFHDAISSRKIFYATLKNDVYIASQPH